jgi:hypothetical protein
MSDTPSLLEDWGQFLDGLRDLAPKLLAKLPDHLRDDPQTQQEVGRLMLEAVSARSLEAIGADGDYPVFLPSLNFVLNIFQPNADTIYKQAIITPGGTYRLRGRRGSLRISRIGTFAPPNADGTIRATTYYDINTLPAEADDRFDVLLSPTKPDGYKGVWWQLDPGVTMLLLRQVAYDWAEERDTTISIERLDVPANRPRRSTAALSQTLKRLPASTAHTASLLIEHVEQLRRDGAVGQVKVWDVTANYGGVFGQFYYETVFELQDDEALLIESDYPNSCLYASLLLTNEVFETIDWLNNHSSLNGGQWKLDSDGRLRVVVSARDPGVHNWLDTAGHRTGVVQGRWAESDSNPLPSVRKVALADLPALLPPDTAKVTPEERDRILRDRRAAFQQRIHW